MYKYCQNAYTYLVKKPTHIAPLASFRFLFGLMMLVSIIRFWYNGWIYEQYVEPTYYFTYYGFGWVKPLGEWGIYALFTLMALSSISVMLGWFYRWGAVLFFITFTYVELIDKTNYLNHYYFVSLVAFLTIWLPAHRFWSVDVWRKPNLRLTEVPSIFINIIRFQLGVVYFFAGIAKINSDWLLRALPMAIWLPAKADVPILGGLFQQKWFAYLSSWFGCIYDCTIPFLLCFAKTRWLAYAAVVGFHLLTAILFPIGMFPYIMILATLIFFPAKYHLKWQAWLLKPFQSLFKNKVPKKVNQYQFDLSKWLQYGFMLWIVWQLVFPFRYLGYGGKLFWHEQGYRFSWRVMLMEKGGYVNFKVVDKTTGQSTVIQNDEYLTPNQIKQMSTQPDMILQFAHFLGEEYSKLGMKNIGVYCDSYVTLNARGSQLFIDPKVDLLSVDDSWQNKWWVMPFKDFNE